MPTVQVNLASASRKETFLARLETPASVERMVGIADGDVALRTRNVACRVRGAVTGWVLAVVMLLIARVVLGWLRNRDWVRYERAIDTLKLMSGECERELGMKLSARDRAQLMAVYGPRR